MPERIAPYILAGGRSSRMGRDKAMIVLGGKTLLARAVETLRSVCAFDPSREGTRVTVIGDRALLEGADRSICDKYPGCGPLGGMEAALGDLVSTQSAEWAFFLPVDMPFLEAGLIDALVREWISKAREGAKLCYVVIDGRPQPLVSMMHRELHPFLEEALRLGEFKVTPVLKSACRKMASSQAAALRCGSPVVWQTIFEKDQMGPIDVAWPPTATQRRSRHLWFANLNTEDDLSEAETFLRETGSSG